MVRTLAFISDPAEPRPVSRRLAARPGSRKPSPCGSVLGEPDPASLPLCGVASGPEIRVLRFRFAANQTGDSVGLDSADA